VCFKIRWQYLSVATTEDHENHSTGEPICGLNYEIAITEQEASHWTITSGIKYNSNWKKYDIKI